MSTLGRIIPERIARAARDAGALARGRNTADAAMPAGPQAQGEGPGESEGEGAPIFAVSMHRYVRLGFITAFVLVVGFGGWAAVASISGAVVAPGVLVVGSRVKDIQHREGGIVAAIHVEEGDMVAAGDKLVTLDDTQPRAGRNLVAGQLTALRARLDRLSAERDGAARVTFRAELMERAADGPIVAEIVDGQRGIFRARVQTLEGQTAQLNEQITQLEEQISGLTVQRQAKLDEIALVNDELADLRQLLSRQYVPASRVTATERAAARLRGEEGELAARTASSRARIAEIRMQILQIEKDFQREVLDEIAAVQTEIATLAERTIAADDELRRVELRAPEAGLIHDMQVSTVGGVVAPGATLMQVVPVDDELVVEARVSPIDIDEVSAGQRAEVMFSGLSSRETPRLEGTVRTVSPNSSRDEATGERYFTVRVALSDDERARLGDAVLVPGMPANVFIRTGDRTVLNYLVKPLLDATSIAMKES